MFTRVGAWYRDLSPSKRLPILFFINCLIWALAGELREKIWPDEQQTLPSKIFDITWMTLFMTAFFNYSTIKTIWSKKNNRSANELIN